jgi:glucokinase
MLLAGDIGGTKTNLAVFSTDKGLRAPVVEGTFPSAQYPSLEMLVGDFLAQLSLPIERASFGVAGPVLAGRATITNLPWVLEETRLQQALKIPSVRLLNDLDAIAHMVPSLEPTDLYTLNEGQASPDRNLAVIAPGTGLGEAFLTWEGGRYHVHASEGGHTDFAPSNALEAELLLWLFKRYPHVSYERICSGWGLPNIYTFLKEHNYAQEPSWVSEQIAAAPDPTVVIVNTALLAEPPSPLCTATMNTFVSILGAEAGNLALKVLATGGVYLGGGIPPRILPLLSQGQFMQAFKRKGRFTELTTRIPVHVILNPKVGLLGAARAGLEMKKGSEAGGSQQ